MATREHRDGYAIGARVGACLASGLLLASAYGLRPFWLSGWLAPGVLAATVRGCGAPAAALLGGAAGTVSSIPQFGYLRALNGDAGAAAITAMRGLQWAIVGVVAVAAERGLPREAAVLVVPAVLTGMEALITVASPHGSLGSLAYGQLDNLIIVQAAALGGTAAVVFVTSLFGSGLASAVHPGRGRWMSLIAPAAIVGSALGYGALRLAGARRGEGPTVAAIGTDRFPDVPSDWASVWSVYAPGVERAAREHGAVLAVLPEKVLAIDSATRDAFFAAMRTTAREARVDIVIGVVEGDRNRSYLITGGCEVAAYDKRHLVPGFERDTVPGRMPVHATAGGRTAALLICKDLDFPETVRASVSAEVELLLVPAWDFEVDARSHARPAIMRGVENGVSVIRSARRGLLTVSDAFGRTVAERETAEDGVSIAVASMPAPRRTLYRVIGDRLGWVALAAGVSALVIGAVRERRRAYPDIGLGRGAPWRALKSDRPATRPPRAPQ